MKSKLYFECHVTVDPLFDEELEKFKTICGKYRFRVADLVMLKSGMKNDKDSFCTARGNDYEDVSGRMEKLIIECKQNQINVRRYKIEDTILDSNINDVYEIL